MEISINRALAELKLLAKKIEQKTQKLQLSAIVTVEHTSSARDEFLKEAQASLDQVRDLILRRNRIKAAIVISNATTTLLVGKVSMTVAEAIERKTSIEAEKTLLAKIRQEYYALKSEAEARNVNVKDRADKLAEGVMGDAPGNDKGIEYTAMVDAYFKKNKFDFIAIPNLEKLIETMQDDIDNFESDVDFALSESNTITQIDI